MTIVGNQLHEKTEKIQFYRMRATQTSSQSSEVSLGYTELNGEFYLAKVVSSLLTILK